MRAAELGPSETWLSPTLGAPGIAGRSHRPGLRPDCAMGVGGSGDGAGGV